MKPRFASWETIKNEYKHKSRKKVIEKKLELKPYYSTIVYTGGIRLDRIDENTLLL